MGKRFSSEARIVPADRARPPCGAALAVAVTARAVDGAANEAVIRLLAKCRRLPKSNITVIGGYKSCLKTVPAAGDQGAVLPRLIGWLGEAPA